MAEEDTKMETEEVKQETPVAAEEAMDIMTALKKVLKTALVNDGLKRGLHEACKALDRGTGRLCCLAENCNEPEYTKLVRALCKSRQTPLLMVQSNKELGEWCGLCKIDETGMAKKVVKTSCAVITDFGEDSTALEVVMKYIKEQN